LKPVQELVISGDPKDVRTRAMIDASNALYLPHTIMMFNPIRDGKKAECPLLAHIQDKMPLEGKPTAYVCSGGTCHEPTSDVDEMEHQLGLKR
jgi:uncharacterized protein YyaL (SSP411 family)